MFMVNVDTRLLTMSLFSENGISEKVETCDGYLGLEHYAHMFVPMVQVSPWIKAVSASIRNFTI